MRKARSSLLGRGGYSFLLRKRGVRGLLFLCTAVLLLFGSTVTSEAFKLPDTGQTKCYQGVSPYAEIPCAGTGQDGAYSINPMSFTDNGNGTVTDSNTGLIWQKYENASTYNWYQAAGVYHAEYNSSSQNVCGSLSLGGYGDWRLPSKKELISIVDYSIPYPGPTINTTYFPNTNSSFYWSSSTYAVDPRHAWVVVFNTGFVNGYYYKDYDGPMYVRCARGGEFEFGNFKDNSNGTVTDTLTGLMWQQGEQGRMPWDSALSYCAGLPLGGHSDWRLPNIKELESITDDTRYNPAIDTTFFSNAYFPTDESDYWSSTTHAVDPNNAWGVDFFFDGGVVDDPKHSYDNVTYAGAYARCVRGGQSGNFGILHISITSHDFGGINVGSSSASQLFTISNNGSANLQIFAISIVDTDTLEFNIQNDNCSKQIIEPSGSCTIEVIFSPMSSGQKNAILSIPSNDPDTPTIVYLSGMGIPVIQYTLSIQKAGAGTVTSTDGKIDCGSDCVEIYKSIVTVTLQAVPDSNSDFTGWSGNDCSGMGDCVLTITSDKIVTASFTPKTFLVSGHVTMNGTGLAGIIMNGLPDNPVTDDYGYYAGHVAYGWSGTVTPVRYGYTFNPSSMTYANVTDHQNDQNYSAIAVLPLITLGKDSDRKGGEVVIPIELTNAQGIDISAISLDIGYDTTVLTNPQLILGPSGKDAKKEAVSNEISPGLLRSSILSATNNNVIADGIIAYIQFNIRANAPMGTTILTNTPSASDPSGTGVSVLSRNGMVEVIAYAIGDCDNNGTVDISEVQSAINMFLKINQVEECVDTNGDGKVKIAEVVKVINNHLGINDMQVSTALKTISNYQKTATVNNLPYLEIGMVTGIPGETVTAPLTLKNVSGYEISALSTEISYDHTKLQNPVIQLGQTAIDAGKTIVSNEAQPGEIILGILSLSNDNPINDGVVAYISFSIKADTSNIAIILTNSPSASNSYGNEIPIKGLNGIIGIADKVTLFTPNGGEVVPSGSNYTILWGAQKEAVRFKLMYSLNNGKKWKLIASERTGLSYNWSVPILTTDNNKCLIRVTGYNSSGAIVGEDISDASYTIEVMKLLSPNGGEVMTSGDTYPITWNKNNTIQPVTEIKIYYSLKGNKKWKLITTVPWNADSYNWTVPYVLKNEGNCKVKVLLKAKKKTVGIDESDNTFTIQP